MSATSASILDHLDKIAVIAGGLFAGTALYMTIGEVPALNALGLDVHWRFFPYMYERAALSQSIFGATAGIAGVLHGTRIIGTQYYRNLWITAGTIFLGMIPYTIICMLPTNKMIIADNKRVQSGSESQINVNTRKELLDKWAILHSVRTIGSLIGFGAMVFGLSHHKILRLGW
ncbi:unnamed protein product [Rotaria sordida]|uniref:DUF1772-domain-containing protein n=1 Tax=Rotaria sordida TaxID=392033 RepID=A0A814UKB0_9BILA|nr:unnamed protein product [Rotaria sordida]CAF1144605.1 unnamed protein product [Rotaria sordida]CAF1155953.1 unnamed protein product [Rotaria sordida]CAF1170406.1 unnamed protein product [Rotaria sordida]CAF1175898.1 unnamed protein product [Rotaria sordida]